MGRWGTALAGAAWLFTLLAPMAQAHAVGATPAELRTQLGALRIPFVPNHGQADARVAYYAPTFGGTVFVTQGGQLVYHFPGRTPRAALRAPRVSGPPGWSLTETFRGGRVRSSGEEPSATRVSSFIGDDPARWQPALRTYERIDLGEVWPGVTVALRARGRGIEKVFTVAPGASVSQIRVRVAGVRALSRDAEGALVARTAVDPVTFTAPVAYQERDGVHRTVPVTYRVRGREYRFAVGAYDRTRPLVIDPFLHSTYLGGGGDDAVFAIAIDQTSGDVYVAGATTSSNFPKATGSTQPVLAGGIDAVVARLSSDLTRIVQATYIGGSGDDIAFALAIDPASHDVYASGFTGSTNFPGTAGGAQAVSGGNGDAFVARFSADLTTLTQATYLGGSGFDQATALAIGPAASDVYVTGFTDSTNFPHTAGGAQPTAPGNGDAFVARLKSDLTVMSQATYLGGGDFDQANALAIAPTSHDVYVAGVTGSVNFPRTVGGAQPANAGNGDAFVARFGSDLTTTALIQSTYLGGGDIDVAYALAIAPSNGDIYVTGGTSSGDFPRTAGGAQPALGGIQDAFVARLTADLTGLTQATYLGGDDVDVALALAVHPTTGDVYVAGGTSSGNFPGTAGGAQPGFGGGGDDAFAARLTATLSALSQATYVGGSDFDEALALALHPTTNEVYVVGATSSADLPRYGGVAQPSFGGGVYDAFIARLAASIGPTPTFADVTPGHAFFRWIEGLFVAGITGGCATSPLAYCPDAAVTRGQIAVFLERGMHGAGYGPPPATGTMFSDVASDDVFAPWIEQLARDGITGGCSASPPLYCPGDGVTRGQMAVFLLRAKHGSGYQPPAATGTMFTDVPAGHPFVPWIEQLALEGITGGCGPSLYCPDAPVTRGQMAVFLVRDFNLPL